MKRLLVMMVSLMTVPVAASVSYRDVVSVIERNPFTKKPTQSVEELIPLLPYELRTNFTFIYESRSPHGGLGDVSKSSIDKLHPRVVLFSKDARVILAFTGNPEKPGYDIVEVVRFVDEGSRFEFSQYILPAAQRKNPALLSEAKHNGSANPASCLRCHGQDPRPVSDSYPLWPGFYGSVRDTFPDGSPELPWYRKFLDQQKQKGVYQHLIWPTGTSVPPYLDPKHYNVDTIEGSIAELKHLPNTRLGMALTELNRKRILRKLKSSPKYDTLKYSLLGGFLGCRLLPVTENAINETYQALLIENDDRIKRLGVNPKGPNDTSLDMMEIGFYGNVVQLAYLASAFEVDFSDWSLAFENNSLSFFDGILSSIYDNKDFYLKEDIILEMLRDLASSDPKFKRYFQTSAAYVDAGYPFGERLDFEAALKSCGELRRKERALKVKLPKTSVTVGKPLHLSHDQILKNAQINGIPFARCTSCHDAESGAKIGRKIPFGSPAQLRKSLEAKTGSGRTLYEEILVRVAAHGHEKMPPYGDPLSKREAEDLKMYLNAVKGVESL